MNKSFQLFLIQLKKLSLPKDKYAIFGSGPLAVRNIREAHDLDIILDKDLFDTYKNISGWDFKKLLKKDGRYVEVIEKGGVEFYKEWGPGDWDTHALINEAEYIDGLPFVKLETVKEWKQVAGREKDAKDIQLIEKYLQNM